MSTTPTVINLIDSETVKVTGDNNNPRNVHFDVPPASATERGSLTTGSGDVYGTGDDLKVGGITGIPVVGTPNDRQALVYDGSAAVPDRGIPGNLIWADVGGGTPGGVIYVDNEVPTGAIDGSNTAFSLAEVPSPATSLLLFYNGDLLRYGVDYALSGLAITIGFAPALGDLLSAYYRTVTSTAAFGEDETPSGTIDGSNAVFTLATAPNPANSLKLFLNGILQQYGVDYLLSGTTITYSVAPSSGDTHRAFYRYVGTGSASSFVDDETPSGSINSSNVTFTLAAIPNPVASLALYLNGDLLRRGTDYTISGSTVTMTTAPSTGDNLLAYYRATAPGTNFASNVIPSGTIDSSNATFTLPQSPNPPESLKLYLNGNRNRLTTDYTLSGATITYVNPPSTGDNHVADYQY